MQTSQEHLNINVYGKFRGQTEWIMLNWETASFHTLGQREDNEVSKEEEENELIRRRSQIEVIVLK